MISDNLLVSAGVALVFFAVAMRHRWRLRKALSAEISDEVCVACDSTELESTGRGQYRCSACGYEGGSGQQEARIAAERERIAALGPAERHTEALYLLTESRTLLLSAHGSFCEARGLSKLDIVGIGGEHSLDVDLNDKKQAMLRGQGLIDEAKQFLMRAALLAGQELGEGLEFPEMIATEFDHFLDNIVSDLRVHFRIGDAIEKIGALHRRADELVVRLGGEPSSLS